MVCGVCAVSTRSFTIASRRAGASAERIALPWLVQCSDTFQREHLQAVERGEVGGLAREVAQRAQLHAGGGGEVGHRISGACVFEAAKAEAVDAAQRVAPQQSALDQRAEQAIERRARQREALRQLGLRQALPRLADRIEHVERLVERGGAFAAFREGFGHSIPTCGTTGGPCMLAPLGRVAAGF